MSISQNGGTILLQQSGSNVQYSTNGGATWSNVSWPLTITNLTPSSSSVLTVEFTTDLTLTAADQYFIIGSDYVTIDGVSKVVTVTGVTYPGLVQNSGNTNITIQNIGITSSGSNLIQRGGWICQQFFGQNISSGIIKVYNCNNSGGISSFSGGILGSSAGSNASGNAIICADSCYNIGTINVSSAGGIFGENAGTGASGTAQIYAIYCYNTSVMSGNENGGIIGLYAGQGAFGSAKIYAMYCYNTGSVGGSSGGILGYGAGANSTGTAETFAINCFNTGDVISNNGGGIIGYAPGEGTSSSTVKIYATNCYFSGTLNTTISGGIIGKSTPINTSIVSVNNCYVNSSTVRYYGSGSNVGSVVNNSSYSTPWNNSIAATSIGTPAYYPSWVVPSNNTRWFLTALNPYAPSNVTASAVNTIATVSWTAADAVNYTVTTGGFTKITRDTSTNFTLTPGTYYFTVTANAPGQTGETSSSTISPVIISTGTAYLTLQFSQLVGNSFTTNNGNVFTTTSTIAPYIYSTTVITTIAAGEFAYNLDPEQEKYQYLTYAFIPLSIVQIGNSGFDGCPNLTSVEFEGNARDFPYSPDVLLPSLTFGDNVFLNSGLKSIYLPNRLIFMGVDFNNCTSLTEVVFPINLFTTIPAGTCKNCPSLWVLQIYSNVTSIASDAFNNTPFFPSQARSRDLTNPTLFTDSLESTAADYFRYSVTNPTANPNTQIEIGASCFNHDTKILCLNKGFEEYIPIQDLRKGDIVKTYLHGYRKIDLIGKGKTINDVTRWNTCMYKMKKSEENGLLEDLIVTGGHAILVDDLGEHKEMNDTLFNGETPKIDGKSLLLSGVSNEFVKIQDSNIYTYYHLVPENNGNDERVGIWANGVLTETPSKNQFLAFDYKDMK